jgi:hypothetical protein
MARTIRSEVMVRLTEAEVQILQAVALPAEPRATTLRRLLTDALSPRDTVLWYRLPPSDLRHRLIPHWRCWGPVGAAEAVHRAMHLESGGFEVWLEAEKAAEISREMPGECENGGDPPGSSS